MPGWNLTKLSDYDDNVYIHLLCKNFKVLEKETKVKAICLIYLNYSCVNY